MKQIINLINSTKKGWYLGKGLRAFKLNEFRSALESYKLALQYSYDNFEPLIYESIAFTYHKLNKFDQALNNAKMSIEQYASIKSHPQRYSLRIQRLNELIRRLETD